MDIDVSKFVGTWVNTNDKTRAIEKVIITAVNGEICMQVFGIEGGILSGDWGSIYAMPLTNAPEETEPVAFKGQYKKKEFEAFLAVNDNKGLLIIAGYFYFENNIGLNNFFTREFYYLK
ncbi:MAG: hypothetical protein ACI8P3_001595 [Saprospiraceae bacterium]|jgi:hypothetical protein